MASSTASQWVSKRQNADASGFCMCAINQRDMSDFKSLMKFLLLFNEFHYIFMTIGKNEAFRVRWQNARTFASLVGWDLMATVTSKLKRHGTCIWSIEGPLYCARSRCRCSHSALLPLTSVNPHECCLSTQAKHSTESTTRSSWERRQLRAPVSHPSSGYTHSYRADNKEKKRVSVGNPHHVWRPSFTVRVMRVSESRAKCNRSTTIELPPKCCKLPLKKLFREPSTWKTVSIIARREARRLYGEVQASQTFQRTDRKASSLELSLECRSVEQQQSPEVESGSSKVALSSMFREPSLRTLRVLTDVTSSESLWPRNFVLRRCAASLSIWLLSSKYSSSVTIEKSP